MTDRSPSSRRVAVTGYGIVSAAGCGTGPAWRAAASGGRALGPLTLFDSPRFGGQTVGQVRDDLREAGAPPGGSRSDRLAWLAVNEAVSMARTDRAALRGCGLILGATTGGIEGTERTIRSWLGGRAPSPRPLYFYECASSADRCARDFGLGGPVLTLSTACSSGSMAIGTAADMIRLGRCEKMLAGGVDSLCRLTVNGFNSLMLVDPDGCRPFDAARAGLTVGEGAGVLMLESESAARARGAEILGYLAGWGATCDAHHATAPLADGSGAARAMRLALADAGLPPERVDYISAHGTATPDNDRSEGAAMRLVFGASVPPFSSLKGCFGHTLAASGALESVVSLLALREGEAPPGAGFSAVDPEIGLSPVTTSPGGPPRVILKNAFGFGGGNVSLVFSGPEAGRTAGTAKTDIKRAESEPPPGIYVRAIDAITPCGPDLESLFAAARGSGPAAEEFDLSRFAPHGSALPAVPVLRCPSLPEKTELPAGARRRLSRLLKMSVIPALRCARALGPEDFPPDTTGVFMGTGAGCLDDTMVFVENAILKEEREPMPARFVHSVHNAPASQIALMLGARGTNSAATHGEISFEASLAQALDELGSSRPDGERITRAWVGAADELSPHELAARTLAAPRKAAGRKGAIPGEGSVVALVQRAEAPPEGALCRVLFCRIGFSRRPGQSGGRARHFDPAGEADRTLGLLREAGLDPADPEIMILTGGAEGRGGDDHGDMLKEWHARTGRIPARAGYARLCGRFHSASAVGFAVATGLLTGKVRAADLNPELRSEPPARIALLYTISSGGVSAATCLERL